MKAKHTVSALDFNIFGVIASCGEPFLGSKFFNCNSISSVVIFLNEKLMVLLTGYFILMILGCVP